MHNKANVLLARQPIFDKKLTTIGYELLYRPMKAGKKIMEISPPTKYSSQHLMTSELSMSLQVGLPILTLLSTGSKTHHPSIPKVSLLKFLSISKQHPRMSVPWLPCVSEAS